MALPWFKFYRADWLGDPLLRSCSLEARAVLIDLICLMEEADPIGYLLINGRVPTDRDLARIVSQTGRKSGSKVARHVAELCAAGVLDRDEAGRIFSRRIVRRAQESERFRAFGRRGGKPTLNPTHNPTLILEGGAYPLPKKLEARREEKDQDVRTSGPTLMFGPLRVGQGLRDLLRPEAREVADKLDWRALFTAAGQDYASQPPSDEVGDLKRRVRLAAKAYRDSQVDWDAAATTQAAMPKPMTAAELADPAYRAAVASLKASFQGSR